MKIGIISFHSCPYSLLGGEGTGGMSVYLRELSSAMTDIPGVKIDVFTRIQNPDLRGVKNVLPDVRVIHLEGGPEQPIDRRQLYSYLPEFADSMAHFISQEEDNYDIIYSHYWLSGLAGTFIKDEFNLPHVHMYHTLALLKRELLKVEKEHGKRLETEEILATLSDAIVSSSWQEKKHLMENFPLPCFKIKVIYPGVNRKLFYPSRNQEELKRHGIKPGEKVLLYVGRIEPVKGLRTVIDALYLLEKRNISLFNQVRLVVIGGGDKHLDLARNREYLRIQEGLQERKLKDKVIFLGSKKQGELRTYYSAADALVVPSLYESFGLVILEALACGTPVLVSKIGEMQTIVRERKNGFPFHPNNPESLVSCFERFFLERGELWGEERIIQDVIQTFSWDKTARGTYYFFSGLVERNASATTIFPPDEILQLT
jgi:D-inositol-3-phosphate glycosyltransferase